jgi:predicted kinase
VVAAGYPVVVDAAFLRRAERDRFRALARERGVPLLIVACDARHETLRERLVRREARPLDASEAGVAVLESQLATQEPLNADEIADAVLVDAERCEARMASVVEGIAARLEQVTRRQC